MVKMAPKLLFTGAANDVYDGLNVARMREERAARARRILRERGVPALLVSGAPNVRYLTGFHWSEYQPHLSYALFFAEQEPIIFAHAGSFQQMPDLMPWLKHWRIGRSWLNAIAGPEATREEANLFAAEIRDELVQRGLGREKLGVVGFDEFAKEALREQALGIVDGWPLLLEATKIKTRDEVLCLQIVSSLCGVGWQKALEVLRPGLTASELSRTSVYAMQSAGAERAVANSRFGPLAFERNITLFDRRIEYGDIGYIPECGTSYMGYTACLYRSFIIGRKPTDKERGWYGKLRDRIDDVIEAIKPGATTADAAQHFPPAATWGYGDEVEVLTVELGHGIGIATVERSSVAYNWPVINRQWSLKHPQVFEPGMVIAIESLEGEHRVGGVRLEDTVVVTETGAELIDHFPRDEILVAGA